MKKISSYFLGFAAVALMAACSNEEIAPEADNTILPGVATGEAYLTVRLQDANAMTRAEGDKKNDHDGGYKNGVASEHAVKDAQFFFFDAQGVYVSKASVWNKGTDNGDHGSTGNNVEFKGNTVIVLRGVTDTKYPKYLLTVLNAEGFTPKSTLEATSADLMQWNKAYEETSEGEETSKVEHFVMSTSSYFDANEEHDKYYYATKIEPGQFREEPISSNTTGAVQVYVERLAAKVQVKTNSESLKPSKVLENKDKLYRLKNVSVAGYDNGKVEPNEGVTEVYVKITNWGLNATTKDSYLSKQLLNEWKTETTVPFTDWSSSNDFRCFWAQSTVYDKDIVTEGTEEQKTLNYTTYGALENTVDGNEKNKGYAYCNENTNTVDKIKSTTTTAVNPAKVTSVLLGAELCAGDGNKLDLIRHNGLLFDKTAYKKYVIDAVNKNTPINIYVPDTENEGQYKQEVSTDWLDLKRITEGNNKGMIEVYAKVDDLGGKKYYSLKTEDGTTTPIEYADAKAVAAALQAALDGYSLDKTLLLSDEAFTDGMMYYNIPIEHLAGFGGTDGKTVILGSYGVVRNHWYQITLNKIENIGTGVFDPSEVIVPEIPKQKYYLDAAINILSWKVVNQSVDL